MREIRHSFKVMTYEIDFAGVVSNIVYVRWLEDLRNLFAEQAIPLGEMMQRGLAPTLTCTEVDYLAPVRFPDVVDARMWLAEAGRARFVLDAEFYSRAAEKLTARARQTGVFIWLQSGRPAPLPEEYKQ